MITLGTTTRRSYFDKILDLICVLLADETGQDLIEYALVAALIALACVASVRSFSSVIGNACNVVGSKLTSAI